MAVPEYRSPACRHGESVRQECDHSREAENKMQRNSTAFVAFRISLGIMATALVAVGPAQPCHACTCASEPTPVGGWTREALVQGYDAVFRAHVVHTRPPRDLGAGATDGKYRVLFLV